MFIDRYLWDCSCNGIVSFWEFPKMFWDLPINHNGDAPLLVYKVNTTWFKRDVKNCFRTCLKECFWTWCKNCFWRLRLFWTLRDLHQSKPLILGRAAAGRAQAPANRLHSYWGLEYLLFFALLNFWVSICFLS